MGAWLSQSHLPFAEQWKTPVFSMLLENRREGAILAGIGALHLGFSLAGLPFWTCPIRAATGIPCPGCGLTRSIFQLLRGDVLSSFKTHAFASLFVLALALIIAALILPEAPRQVLVAKIRTLEEHSGITAIFLTLLMLYWIFRMMGLIPFPNQF